MKSFNYIILILVIFFKTGNVLSKDNVFNVNNIQIIKTSSISNEQLANQAIKKGYKELVEKILLDKDKKKLADLNLSQIKNLVSYYQIVNKKEGEIENQSTLSFNIFFDKQKLHKLFFKNEILYSEINNKEIYLLPIFQKNNQIFVYNQNFFYDKWNEIYDNKLIEIIIPIEDIEVVQNINSNKNNILDIDLNILFQEYSKKNLALVLIEKTSNEKIKIFLKTNILGKKINKALVLENSNLNSQDYYSKIIQVVSKEIIDLIKSQNLIDIRTPSFLNTKFRVNKKNNLVELEKRLKKIDQIDEIFIQEFNSEFVLLKIKYLGKLNRIIKQLEEQNIILKLTGDQWRLKII